MGKQLNVGLLGYRSFFFMVTTGWPQSRSASRARTGVELDISKILVRDLKRERTRYNRDLLTTEPAKVLKNGCDLIVELVGELEPLTHIYPSRTRPRRKHVVTANKYLLRLRATACCRQRLTPKRALWF